MAKRESKRVILVAIAANLAIAGGKYAAALLTGSSAMLAEAFHSTADSGNELLLLLGTKRSLRPPDELHPYGHGKALYFYSLLVAVYIFGVGGGLAIHHGIVDLRNPRFADHPGWNCLVLLFSFAFEFWSWKVSYRELRARKDPDESTFDEIIGSKDPTVFTVFLEDSAGLVGALIAFLGIVLARLLNKPYLDPAASIVIGVLLAGVAILLGRESGALLIGERTNRARLERVKQIIAADPSILEVGDLLTMQLGPSQVLLTVEIQFRRDLNLQQVEKAIAKIESRIRREEPTIERIFIEAKSFTRSKKKPRQAA